MDPTQTRFGRRVAIVAAVIVVGAMLTGCSAPASAGPASSGGAQRVNIGYFPNVTHAPGLIADAEGLLSKRLGEAGAGAVVKAFNAGPDVIQAILSGSLDISYIGPNPTVTAYLQSRGEGIRVIAGSTSGGASLVVRPEITAAAQLKGKRLATPQLGNTQDIALRHWLSTQGLSATADGGGDVSVLPQANSAAVQAFSAGEVDGGWLPEPFATRLVKAGGKVLVDERTLWPQGRFVTTNVIARTDFVQKHPDLVRAFLEAHLDALALIESDPAKARSSVSAQIKKITEQELDPAVLEPAWANIEFTPDPLASALRTSADHAAGVGLLPKKPSDGFAQLWDVALLNEALTARGASKVAT